MTALVQPLIKILSDGRFHSGTELGEMLQVSRAAIWKTIKKLEELGLDIHSVRGRGYKLERPLSLLDAECISNAFPNREKGLIHELTILDSIDSTNAYAMRELQNDSDIPGRGKYAVYLAEQQTSGKGRRGRPWSSPFGENVYLTMVRQFDTGEVGTDGLSLVIGMGVIRALNGLGIEGLGIKWPNDVLHNNKKLSGILIEISGDVYGLCQLLIGIGINTFCRDEDMREVDQPWTDLFRLSGKRFDRNRVVAATVTHIISVLEDFERHGLEKFLQEWESLDVMRGEKVELHFSGSSKVGIARGISGNGALLLETDSGVHPYIGGEVSLRRAPQ